jgi:hypothetical protein
MKHMARDPRFWTAAAAFALASWLIVPNLLGRRPPAVAADAAVDIPYVCLESGEVFRLPLSESAQINPTTGKPTLMPAVYDSKRKKWKPGPPLEVMRKKGLLKPAS